MSDLQGNKILVKGIPTHLNPDKLTIYFQKRKVGGGDVASVTFPVSSKEPDTAIVAFDDSKTVASVLSRTHTIGSAKLTVSALNLEPEIFDSITAQITDFTIHRIKSKHDVNEVLETVCDSTGCVIEGSGDSKFAVKGKWYQVRAAFERFEAMVSRSLEKPTESCSSNTYFSQTSTPTPMKNTQTRNEPSQPTPVLNPAPKRERLTVYTMVDKDIYAYMELVHAQDIANIRTKYKVSITTKIMGEAVKIELVEAALDADLEAARKAIDELSTKLNQTVGQDTVEIDESFPETDLEFIFSMLRPEFPMVHMAKTDTAPNQILFIAPENQKCRMAMDMFKYLYASKKSSEGHSS